MSAHRPFASPMQRLGGGAAPGAAPPAAAAAPRSPAEIAARRPLEPIRAPAMPSCAALVEGIAMPDSAGASSPEVEAFLAGSPGLTRQMQELLVQLARRGVTWGEVIGFGAWELLDMAQMSLTYVQQGRFAQAEEAFGALCHLAPNVPLFWLAGGDVLEELRELTRAQDTYRTCGEVAVDPALPEALIARVHRGVASLKAGGHQTAVEAFVEVLQRDPQPAGDRSMLAVTALQMLLGDGRLTPEALLQAAGGALGSH
jgi:tetratricopeptide (TPR) repeat protein